jgi:hypothetical protein
MSKIPVGATIADAYRFVLENFGRVLSVTWLAALLAAVIQVVTMQRSAAMMAAVAAHDRSVVAQIGVMVPLYLLLSLLTCVQAVAVTQLVLGRRDGRGFIAFPLGAPLWRLVGATLLAVLAFAIVLTGSALTMLALGAVAKLLFLSRLQYGLVAIALVIGLLGVILYVALRLFFLIAPAVIDRDKAALDVAWKLTRGNFWRILLVALAVALPLLVFKYVLSAVLMGGAAPILPHDAAGGRAALRQAQAAWDANFAARWYISVPILALFGLLLHALAGAAQVFAYRSLAPVAGDSLPD